MNISNLTRIRANDPMLAEALASLGNAVDNIATHTNTQPQSQPATPNKPPNLVVSNVNGVFSAKLGTPPPAGSQYHLEYSDSPNFATVSAIPMGAGNNQWSGALHGQKLYFRARSVSMNATAKASDPVYHGSSAAPVAVNSPTAPPAQASLGGAPVSISNPGGGGGGGGFIPAPYSPPGLAEDVTDLAVTASAVFINGAVFTKLHVTCKAPTEVSNQPYTFQGIILALDGFEGSSYPQAIAGQQFLGDPAGDITLDAFVPSSDDTVTVYAVSYNTESFTEADWTQSPKVESVSLAQTLAKPASPSGLAGTAMTKAALLTWDEVITSGLSAYLVYRAASTDHSTAVVVGIAKGLGAVDANGNTPTLQFVDFTAETGTEYDYWVNTVLMGNVQSNFGTPVTVTPA